jgi:glucosamine--fructose-6-phosphate aminotransferase (isomerizing)
MCGIAGYLGPKNADQILLVALERLKYRGYDSAGIALLNGGGIVLRRAAGTLEHLTQRLLSEPMAGCVGIAHTRWATHGAPTEANSHPHLSADLRIAVVHNGIIENHDALRKELQAAGVAFRSQTDTEVIPHLIAQAYAGESQGDPLAAVRAVLPRLSGSFAFAVVFADFPQRILAVRQGSPLLVGRGPDAMMLASDIPALLPHASHVLHLDDGQLADLSPGSVAISTFAGEAVPSTFAAIEISADAVSKGSFDSFMAKEIAEQPEVLARLLASRINTLAGHDVLVMPDLGIDLGTVTHVSFIACGTSWHAALLAKRFIEHLAGIPVEVEVASEYRYRKPVAIPGGLAVAISQSGETADTLASMRLAKQLGLPAIALVNVVTSTIAREAHGVMPLFAGPEIGVASTKAYTAQVLALYLFALQIAKAKGLLTPVAEAVILEQLRQLPEQVRATLAGCESAVTDASELFAPADASVFLGRLGEHPTALEGALKLKEIAYIHANGYPAGEFKHGPIALVTATLPVVCLCPQDEAYEKMLSNVQEVRARHGRLIGVGHADDQHLRDLCDHVFPVERAHALAMQPILCILPLQRYAYHVAKRRGCNVDQPRNLAKSVTVE